MKRENMDNITIKIKNLRVNLGGNMALNNISLDLARGKIIGFIGPSGAGKTTLIRSIVGRQRLAGGSITIDGLPAGAPALRSRMSYMTQEPAIYKDLSVMENLEYFATMVNIARSEMQPAIAKILQLIDLEAQSRQMAKSLSGGQKQRLSLAIALLGNPQIMVLDEPTVGLDPMLRAQLWKLFTHLAAGGGTLLISSHVMDEADRCDDLVLVREGKILAHDSPVVLCSKTHSKNIEETFLKLVGQTS
jgi:ABC-2 type transport system ATP-binding protein